MNKQLVTVFSIAILLTVTVVASINLTQTADAAKSKGNSLTEVGSKKVCGDRLCSESPPEERKTMIKSPTTTTTTSDDIDSLFERMDSIHKKHQSEMSQMWKSMTPQEQAKMFQNMEQMVGKMESMNTSEHMKMMDMMMIGGSMNHGMMDMMNDPAMRQQMMDMMMNDPQMMQDMMNQGMMMGKDPMYNEVLNPRQIDYPNTLGFSDLHIHAIRHLDVDKSHGTADHLLQTIVHHHCKVYDDNTASCLLFPYGMTDQDKPYGIEYVITSDQYQELPDEEKHYWHYHKTEFPRAQATFPDLTDEELAKVQPILDETYGKVVYFWNVGDTYPMGEPYVLVVQDIPDQ